MSSFRFFRAGGVDQVSIESGADIAALHNLDQKLWVALSCPTKGLHFDARTLAAIDEDGNGQIRAPELLDAIAWTGTMLKSLDTLLDGKPELALTAIDDSTEEGASLLASAKEILKGLGKAEASSISVDDTSSTDAIFAATRFNGDGVVPADAAEDEALEAIIGSIIELYGAVDDRSGKPGVDTDKVDTFFNDARGFAEWWGQSETDEAVMPLGDATAAAVDAMVAVRAKVDDWFTRCRLAAFDSRSEAALNRGEADYVAIASRELSAADEVLAEFPLAQVSADASLPLDAGLNPAWTAQMAAFRTAAVVPLLGERTHLTEVEWGDIKSRLGGYEAWSATAPGTPAETLGIERVREILGGSGEESIRGLLASDLALEPQANAIGGVDKLVRFNAHLRELIQNFVSFREFYGPDPAIFQAGTLYLDHRSCNLTVEVVDMARHNKLAASSQMFLAYCACTRVGSNEKKNVAVAITDGDVDNVMVGRNGIFYDRDGNDWHATITKVMEAPISIRQAFFAPYKRAAKFIQDQINAWAESKDKAAQGSAGAALKDATAKTATGAATPPPSAFDIGKFAGIAAAGGLALGAIGATLGALASGFLALPVWQMPLAIIALLLVISGPSMFLAWLKLRQRNLGPLLDANGWAINANTRINVPFGEALTDVAKLPKGSKRSNVADPYQESHGTRNLLIFLFVVGAVLYGLFQMGVLAQVHPALAPQVETVVVAAPAEVPVEVAAEAPPAE